MPLTLPCFVFLGCAIVVTIGSAASENTPAIREQPLCTHHLSKAADAVNEEVTLVQTRRGISLERRGTKQDRNAQQQSSLSQLFPLYWVHVPKCGSSFFNSLVNLPGACDLHSVNITPETDLAEMCHTKEHWEFCAKDVPKVCPGSFSFHMCTADHSGIEAVYDSVVKGHGVIMLRQPEQRIISGYYSRFHSEPHSWPKWYYGRSPRDLKEYARVVSACAVKMLTREGRGHAFGHWDRDAPCGHPTLAVTAEEAQLALERLRSGFIFVGITEDWDMSVCLLHMMVGGECHASEFANSNPGNHSTGMQYDTSELEGFVDVYDGLLYEEAKRIYKSNLQKYGASPSTCEPCFRHRSRTR